MASVDWFAAEAVAVPAPARRRARPVAAPKPTRTRHRTRRVTPGILWISAFALLLAGVVAVNVAVLRANVAVNNLDEKQVELQNQNAALSSQVSSAIASIRISRRPYFGLSPLAADTSYLDLNQKYACRASSTRGIRLMLLVTLVVFGGLLVCAAWIAHRAGGAARGDGDGADESDRAAAGRTRSDLRRGGRRSRSVSKRRRCTSIRPP